MGIAADTLLQELVESERWPLPRERLVWDKLRLYIALRESDREQILDYIEWEADRPYMIDPIPPRIAEAWSSAIYREAPEITAASEGDQSGMDRIVEDNRIGPELQRGVRTSSSEGEAWWRCFIDRELSDRPMVRFYSRTAVTPLFVAGILRACAFVSAFPVDEDTVYRHFEIHDDDTVMNVLFLGQRDQLGGLVPLTDFPATAFLEPEWDHRFGEMHAGRIINKEGIDPTLGVSDYEGIGDMLLALNEALTIGQEDMRLVGKKRIAAPEDALDEWGRFPSGEAVIVTEAANQTLGERDQRSAFQMLEYTFEPEKNLLWRRGLCQEALTRIGITPQFLAMAGEAEGLAASGTHLRVRLLPTTAAAEDRAVWWDDISNGVPQFMWILVRLDALPVQDGGYGRAWSAQSLLERPAIERGDPLPDDENELTERETVKYTSGVQSLRLTVQNLHKDWTDEQIDEEVAAIRADEKARGGSLFGDLGRQLDNGTLLDEPALG